MLKIARAYKILMEIQSDWEDGEEYNAFTLALESLEKQLNNRWMPVGERLPTREEYNENNGRFIVTDGMRRYQSLFDVYETKFFIDIVYKGNCNFTEAVDNKVIAWKALPEPYEGELE